ncbi:MAG: hypothetical protein WBO09_03440 [Methylocystis silviterrae]|uniref:hypothetical protein n=1 Tax=Methylocystis silviterrae TaxID=2743612 RepID=UPI003C786BA4
MDILVVVGMGQAGVEGGMAIMVIMVIIVSGASMGAGVEAEVGASIASGMIDWVELFSA